MIESYEGLSSCAQNAYEFKTNTYPPPNPDILYPDPGQKFNEGGAFFKYPGLALLAW